mgnify:CR=1 FL=1
MSHFPPTALIASTRDSITKKLKKAPSKFEMPSSLQDKHDGLIGYLEDLESELSDMQKEIAETSPLKDLSFKVSA